MMEYVIVLIEIIVKFLEGTFYFFNQVWIFFQFISIDKHIGTFSYVFHMLENIFADLCCYNFIVNPISLGVFLTFILTICSNESERSTRVFLVKQNMIFMQV